LEGSRDKAYSAQRELVESHARRTGQPYEVPGALEAATAILMHHARTGERLFGDSPWTYTRCQELCKHTYIHKIRYYLPIVGPVFVGGFASSGLGVSDDYDSRSDRNFGVAGCRKF
jgi:hypothetical protein